MFKLVLLLLLIPASIAAQTDQVSVEVRKLESKPRFGSARLTWSDGRQQSGYIARVTNQFVSFVTSSTQPLRNCENVELSKIKTVEWLSGTNSAAIFGGEVFVGAVLAPAFIGHGVVNTFRRMAPPLDPIRGTWTATRFSSAVAKSTLVFDGSTVRLSETSMREGRYSVDQNLLRMTFDGEPEIVVALSFNCNELILNNSAAKYVARPIQAGVAAAPIVGE